MGTCNYSYSKDGTKKPRPGAMVGSTSAGGTQYTTSDNTVEEMASQVVRVQMKDRLGLVDVTAAENGEIVLTDAESRDTGEGSRKYPVMEYTTKGAYIDIGHDDEGYSPDSDKVTQVHGVNFDNVRSVSGYTYPLRPFLKSKGFKWGGSAKKWVKP